MTDRLTTIRTPWTDILSAQQGDAASRQRCLAMLAERYYEPVRAFFLQVFQALQPGDIDDLTHDFFVRFLEKSFLDLLDRERGRFRGFLMTAARNFARDENDKRLRRKNLNTRYGEEKIADTASHTATSAEDDFNRAWARGLVRDAVEVFRLECQDKGKSHYYEVFKQQALEQAGSYGETAASLGLTEKAVTNYLYRSKQRIREILEAMVRESVLDPDDTADEMATLRGYLS